MLQKIHHCICYNTYMLHVYHSVVFLYDYKNIMLRKWNVESIKNASLQNTCKICRNIFYRHCMYLEGGCDGVCNEGWRRTFTRKYTVQRPTVYTWARIEVRSDSDKMRSKRRARVKAETSYRIFRSRCRATSLVGIIRNAHTDYQNCRFLRYLFTGICVSPFRGPMDPSRSLRWNREIWFVFWQVSMMPDSMEFDRV